MSDKILVPMLARITALEFLVEFLMWETAKPYGKPSEVLEQFAREEEKRLSALAFPNLDPVESDAMIQETTDAFRKILQNVVRRSRLAEDQQTSPS